MCNLKFPDAERCSIDQGTIDSKLPREIRYACRYWVHHLKESDQIIQDGDTVHQFLDRHILQWLESLAVLGQVRESITMMNDLLSMINVRTLSLRSLIS